MFKIEPALEWPYFDDSKMHVTQYFILVYFNNKNFKIWQSLYQEYLVIVGSSIIEFVVGILPFFFFLPSSKQYSAVSREVFYFCSDNSAS